VLGLPFAFSYLGWVFGLLFLLIASTASLYTSWLLASMHEQEGGKRINRYRDLGVHVFGPLGKFAITPFQVLVMVRSRLARPRALLCAAARVWQHLR
jgi:amino acid permease